MNTPANASTLRLGVLLALGALLIPAALRAGQPISEPPVQSAYEPLRGELTLGIGGTADRLAGSTDLTIPLWKSSNQDDMLFLDGHWTGNSGHEEAYSAGLGYRHRLGGSSVILGVNGFWDHGIFSGQSFDQAGAGLEVLSHWVDFRANGYFTGDGEAAYQPSHTTIRSMSTATSISQSQQVIPVLTPPPGGTTTITTTTTTRITTRKTVTRNFINRERALPGFDTELGFLIPGLDPYMETRLFGGYTYFQAGYGHDISAGTARIECRVVPAVILDGQYKSDARLLDGDNHWFWGLRAEIPFDLGNLVQGKSPFAGITEAFTPKWMAARGSAGPTGDNKNVVSNPETERNRMNENIIRAWRPQMDRSGTVPNGIDSNSRIDVQKSSTTNSTFTQNPFIGG